MKAQELLRRYAAGERDFRYANLHRQSLKGKDLSGSDFTGSNFSYADIRGVNFSRTILKDANLTGVNAGLRDGWVVAIGLLVLIVTLAILSNSILIVAIASLIVAFASVGLTLNSGSSPLAIGVTTSIAIGVVGGISLILSLAIYIFTLRDLAPSIVTIGCIPVCLSLLGCIVLAGVGSRSGVVSTAIDARNRRVFGVLMGIADELIKFFIISTGGTSFLGSDLTGANFTQASLRDTTFREATLNSVCWLHARGLERSQIRLKYLNDPYLRQLALTLNGREKSFNFSNLEWINLQKSNLQDASFISANLNYSDLRGADLSGTILKQSQLEGADLTGAILTGTYIEDWGITSTTKLENVTCEYVYMRVPTKENPNPLRKPDNLRETFAEGEFADFIQPFFDTLDLYHSQDVDPRAISIALRDLSANHPEENLQFVAIERRGTTGLNLRFTTTPGANKSELNHEYFSSYDQIKKELPIAVQIQLAEQDVEIRTLKGTIEQFIQIGTHQSIIQAENIQVIQGELVVTENRGININAGDNANINGLTSGDGVLNLGTISGNVTNAINQLPDRSDTEQPNLKLLLTQLQQAIQTEPDLSEPDKSDLLEQVQTFAEVEQIKEPTKREGLTRKAMKMFDATLKNLPDTAKIAEACGKLLPLVLKALGFSP
jgi:uncharacterized protein YjbI with pentapeptide repeats